MGEIKVFRADQFDSLVDTLNREFHSKFGCVLLLETPLPEKQASIVRSQQEVICFAVQSPHWKNNWPDYIYGFVNNPPTKDELVCALEMAKRVIELKHENEQLKFKNLIAHEKSDELLKATEELSSERDIQKLCEHVLTTIRRLTSAEGASLYLANPKKNELRFSHVQNEKLTLDKDSFALAIDESSMAGACAFRKKIIHVPDVYRLSKNETFQFNPSFDQKMNYRTRSVACFPLLKRTEELVGVIQIINSKQGADFSKTELDIARALSGPIAVALETALLYSDIEELFDGFIKASVTAIESRDPTTSGHSERVAKLTVGLAQEVSDSSQKSFREIKFNDLQIKEIKYASLLHDFGKIGVPEHVLLKEKKLYPIEYMEIFRRYSVLKLAYPDRANELEEIWHSIVSLNEPTVNFEEIKNNLAKYLDQSLRVMDEEIPLLTETEYESLSIGKGSLTDEDRLLIESHVTHTYNFLKQIPWTRYLNRVPEIAYAHHEKLDGTGYPRSLQKKNIPIESQIMAVADIYDALTAKDRPYKKSLTSVQAIEILFEDSKKGKLNRDLVELFAEKKVYKFNASSSHK